MKTEETIGTVPSTEGVLKDLREIFHLQKEAFFRNPNPSYEERMEDLKTLGKVLRDHGERIVQVIQEDFGARSWHETMSSEVIMPLSHLRYTMRNLKRWMRPVRRKTEWMFKPARLRVYYQPRGVVGIIAPWNYPVYLVMVPLTSALAAGNRVMIKPSEVTPKTAQYLKEILESSFPREKVAVIVGDVEVGKAFTHLPFDYLLFTGSTQVGKEIMRACSENLTPLTLELGGKSPTIIHPEYPLREAVNRIVAGKFLNAGQTCVAPDYLFVHHSQRDEVVDLLVQTIKKAYPTLRHNPDYTAIVNDRHYQRLKKYIEDAQNKGATVIEVNPSGEVLPESERKIPPTLILNPKDDMRVMKEEIFGPILPILTYNDDSDWMEYVQARPHPLALYYFDTNKERIERVLRLTLSGGATINDAILHVAQDDLPFGGVGESGFGAYHGFEGFESFSHKKGVMIQSRFSGAKFIHPPYRESWKRIMRFLTRL